MTARPLLSIVVVSWNTRAYLDACLNSLYTTLGALRPEEVEIIVADNASADGSGEMVRSRYPQVRLIENVVNAGFARANNQAIMDSSGEYILLLNSDTEVQEGALQILVDFMDLHPRAGSAGARLLNSDGSLQAACHPMLTPAREFWRLVFLDQWWPRATYAMDRWDTRTPRQVEVIKGACLLLRREALDEVGLLDEQYHMYTEEVDLCYRLGEAGWELWYVPNAVVTHHGAASSAQVADDMYMQLYRSKLQFYRKLGGERRARWFKILTAAAYLPRAIVQPRQKVYRRLLVELPGM